ncbi:alpha-(1,3)-fucosyltransferase 7-like isoform X2 [Leguminivora glycinivorella]|uniref:alpha-(1,3)-fucosyltransferase 7-like isoform X2 n=1 Tax=Leguminivora glycinivorella TaxID=1035111 RepID=UPI00200C1BB4|nr:alpha-(1,3)-fucosyltransferase 7-like isoform X2 [Leguminivora glycinivorella]
MVFKFFLRYTNLCKIFLLCVSVVTLLEVLILYARYGAGSKSKVLIPNYKEQHRLIVKDFYESRKDWVTSNLGTYLFKNGIQLNNTAWNQSLHRVYDVLIWKHWKWLRRRHLGGFIEHDSNPLYGCSVSNCRFSGDTDISSADAVVIHIQKGLLPEVVRKPHQIWIFWVDESPKHTFSLSTNPPSYVELSNIFNWIMTYRTDADIPIPYGRTVALLHPKTHYLRLDNNDHNLTNKILEELVPFWKDKQRNVLAAILTSNCIKDRMLFLTDLKKHMKIDIYGRCADEVSQRDVCPGHYHDECKILSRYMFYLVIENSKCRQYITEKSFHHAYGKGAIPVFVGPFLEDCIMLLPPNSFLHIDDFMTPEHLAEEIVAISRNVTKLLSYHAWRNHFKVINEHGYFGTMSTQMCRICEALNYNEKTQKLYGASDIRRFLDPEIHCD